MPMEEKGTSKVGFDPNALAVQYYFGDLQYWKLPRICVEALENGFDGRTLRILAGLANPVATDIRADEIDEAFREMGVNAPISKDDARLVLAMEAARRGMSGQSNAFNEAMHIRIHLCEWHKAPRELQPIVALSEESEHAPRWKWEQIERQLRDALQEFVNSRG